MKQLIAVISLVLLLPGCVTYKRCSQKFPPVEYHTVDTIRQIDRVVENFFDTTIEYLIISDTIEKLVPVQGKLVEQIFDNFTTDTSYLQNKWSGSMAVFNIDGLFHRLYSKDTTLSITLSNAIRERDHFRDLYVKERTKQVEVLKSRFNSFWFGMLVTIGLVIIGSRIFRS